MYNSLKICVQLIVKYNNVIADIIDRYTGPTNPSEASEFTPGFNCSILSFL